MADRTSIEWCHATVNAISGCTPCSPGCANCYAMRAGGRRMPNHPSTGLTQETRAGHVWTGAVRFNEQWARKPLSWQRPRRIFWNAHGDAWHESVPIEWIDRELAIAALTLHHRHLFLTKRSARMRAYFADPAVQERILAACCDLGGLPTSWTWPLPNVWLGVSVEDQTRADERIPDLLATPAALRWLSCEPLLGSVDLGGFVRKSGGGNRAWSTWTWPSWVPETTQRHIEDFWRPEYGRGPDEWLRGAINNGQPPLGTRGAFETHYKGRPAVEGRFVPCWNNIGVVVADDGECHWVGHGTYQGRPPYIDWVIAGGESGPGARHMHPDLPTSLLDQCENAGVPFLFKQWGEYQAHIVGPEEPRSIGVRPGHVEYRRVGTKAAGRRLNGVLHDAYPELFPWEKQREAAHA